MSFLVVENLGRLPTNSSWAEILSGNFDVMIDLNNGLIRIRKPGTESNVKRPIK